MEPRSHDHTTYELSKHAEVRARQRGIRMRVIALVMFHGDLRRHPGEGLVSVRLSRRRLEKVAEIGVPASDREKAAGFVLLIDAKTQTVVTAMHDTGRDGRRYRNQYETREQEPSFIGIVGRRRAERADHLGQLHPASGGTHETKH